MIYADSGVLIRLIEGVDRLRLPIESRLHDIRSQDKTLITSRLSRLECRCKPLREGREYILSLYDGFFDTQEVLLKEIDAAVIELATEFRATFGLKASDAIHAATAILAGVSEFWTADRDFLRCPELNVELFDAV
jgi:predicted nucleic acid-binding protein